jgi:preprotein translocase subunit SecY
MNSAGMGELFARLRFVLIALLIYRIGTHIPVPGIDPEQLASLFDQNQGTILGLANVFSGWRTRAHEYSGAGHPALISLRRSSCS